MIQIMASKPRADICINLPALRKLDAMLIVRHRDPFLVLKQSKIVLAETESNKNMDFV